MDDKVVKEPHNVSDELYVFRGWDEKDIQNYFCVAEYISCLKKYGILESAVV